MINFKGDEDAYFLPLSNKHGLSTLLPSKLFTSSVFLSSHAKKAKHENTNNIFFIFPLLKN